MKNFNLEPSYSNTVQVHQHYPSSETFISYLDAEPILSKFSFLICFKRYLTRPRYTELAKQYGGLYTVKAGHHTIAIITDRRIVRELIEEKGSTASNRPSSYIIQHLIGENDHLLTLQYGQTWRVIRKLVHQYFTDSMCDKEHVHLQHAEGIQMLRDFIVDPENHMQHPRRYSCSVMTSTSMSILFLICFCCFDL